MMKYSLFAFLLTCSLLLAPAAPSVATNTLEQTADTTITRLPNGYWLQLGGPSGIARYTTTPSRTDALSSALTNPITNPLTNSESSSHWIDLPELNGHPELQRSGHSTTVLPNGQILVWGGWITADNASALAAHGTGPTPAAASVHLATTALILHLPTPAPPGTHAGTPTIETTPAVATLQIITPNLLPRAHHTATLLTDGRILFMGGLDAQGQAVSTVEIWYPTDRTSGNTTERFGLDLTWARWNHWATLLPSTSLANSPSTSPVNLPAASSPNPSTDVSPTDVVVLSGGSSPQSTINRPTLNPALQELPGNALSNASIVLAQKNIRIATDAENILLGRARSNDPLSNHPLSNQPLPSSAHTLLQQLLPAVGTIDLPLRPAFRLLFSEPMHAATVSPDTITLFGPTGVVPIQTTLTENGRLLWITPAIDLFPAAQYTLFLKDLQSESGTTIPLTGYSYSTQRISTPNDQALPLLPALGPQTNEPSLSNGANSGGDPNASHGTASPSYWLTQAPTGATQSDPATLRQWQSQLNHQLQHSLEELWIPQPYHRNGHWWWGNQGNAGADPNTSYVAAAAPALSATSQQHLASLVATAAALPTVAANALRSSSATPDPNQNQEGAVASLSGQVLKITGEPLVGVTLRIDIGVDLAGKAASKAVSVQSDDEGFFVFSELPAGPHILIIDGATANRADATYGYFRRHIELPPNQHTHLKDPVWLAKLDPNGWVKIPSPLTQDLTLTTPHIPGWELHLPKGTVIRDHDGSVVTQLNISPIPVDRAPMPLPNFSVPVYFTVQPGGAWLQNIETQRQTGATIVYPNYYREVPGTKAIFWHYDPLEKDWYPYGEGTISENGKQVLPDAGVQIYDFAGAMISPDAPGGRGPSCKECCGAGGGGGGGGDGGGGNAPSPGKSGSDHAGDPCSTSTGVYYTVETDWFIPDLVPLELTRTTRSNYTNRRLLGLGSSNPYDLQLYPTQPWQQLDLILSNGSRVAFHRTSPGTSLVGAVFESTEAGSWYGAVLSRNNPRSGWDILRRDGTRFYFPQYQRVTEITDRLGRQITIRRRDSNGQAGPIQQIIGPTGRSLSLVLDSNDQATQISDHTGRTMRYTFDANGRLTQVTDPLGQTTQYGYDTNHRLTQITDKRGNISLTNAFDANGFIQKQTYADGNTIQFAYTTKTAANGSPQITQTDVTDQKGNIRRIQFNDQGAITQDTYPLGKPEEQTTSTTYNSNGQMTSSTDALNRTTTYAYDAKGNVSQVTKLAGTAEAQTTQYTYEPTYQRLVSMQDPLGRTTTMAYDANGNLTQTTDASGNRTTFSYNDYGQLLSLTNANNETTRYTYQGADLIQIEDPLGRKTTFTPDPLGRTVASQDPMGNVSQTEYDALNRITQTTDAGGGTIQYQYDANGNLTQYTDPNGNATQYSYDKMNRLTQRTDALGGIETLTYDQAGKVQQTQDRNGHIAGFQYDPRNRITQIGYGATIANPTQYDRTLTYTWDAGDRLTQLIDSQSGRITRTWTPSNQLQSEETPQGKTQSSYDRGSRRTTFTVGTGTPLQYTYDDNDRLTKITQGTQTVQFQYDAASRRSQTTLPNGVTANYTYDAAGQLTKIEYKNGGTSLGDLNYAYDRAGRRTQVTGTLAQTTLPTATTQAAQYDANNRLTTWNGATLTYDRNGNLTQDNQNSYTWNSRNQLSQITGSTTATFSYDAINRRTEKKIGTNTTQFLYDGLNFVQEQNGATVKSTLITGGIDEFFGRSEGAKTYYPLVDALGTVLALTDEMGNIVTNYAYEVYGKTATSASPSTNSQQYTGRENDPTGLYYYRARYYSPQLQRFISEDPIGIRAGPNGYGYVGGNPVKFRDPVGLFAMHGNWCGPNWTGGRKHPYYSAASGYYEPPTDYTDAACERHDKCFSVCRVMSKCDKNSRKFCMTLCNQDLANAQRFSSSSGTSIARSASIWLAMQFPPDPEDNDSGCGCEGK